MPLTQMVWKQENNQQLNEKCIQSLTQTACGTLMGTTN